MTIRGPFAFGLLVLLFLSLAANLLIVGFSLGRVTSGPPPGAEIERIVMLAARTFPPPLRDLIEERSRGRRNELRDQFREMERARRATYEAMRADPFDPAALEEANAAFRAATEALQRTGQEIVAEVLADTPAEVRKDIRTWRGGRSGDRPPRPLETEGRRGPPDD